MGFLTGLVKSNYDCGLLLVLEKKIMKKHRVVGAAESTKGTGMDLRVEKSVLQGAMNVPGSKSHTIRAVAIAALAAGESEIAYPLESSDARAAFRAYRALGAEIVEEDNVWRVQGMKGEVHVPEKVIDVGNSGTTMRIALGSAALLTEGMAVLTGDEQVCRRPCGPLVDALNGLGARVRSTRDNGCPPIVVEGRLKGGTVSLEAVTSQYVTALLINAPLAEQETCLQVPVLHEKPYVHMTLDWLERQGVTVDYADDLSEFRISGGQAYAPVRGRIPGDFSSATFFLAAGALPGNAVLCQGLDMSDTQGDKAVVDYLRAMGARVTVESEGIRVEADRLQGCELDLNATPDALPMLAVLACFAEGTTRLVNVPQARLKETDRIAVMRMELEKMGARIQELPDGMVIEGGGLHAATVEGHGDHRVVMALAMGATQLSGATVIHGYEAVEVTFPTFASVLTALGGVAQ